MDVLKLKGALQHDHIDFKISLVTFKALHGLTLYVSALVVPYELLCSLIFVSRVSGDKVFEILHPEDLT